MNYIIYHDKLIEHGGSEVVLEELVSFFKPMKIITTCVRNLPSWESKFNTTIEHPWFLKLINSQKLYIIFYPFICLSLLFYKPRTIKGVSIIVYSSTAAKFISTSGAYNAVLYSNFPAKPLLKFNDYFKC